MNTASPRVIIKCINCTCTSGAFKWLTDDQLLKVDFHRTEIVYKKGEILCKQGAFMSNVMFIKSGLVKLYLESEEQPTTISLETNGFFIGLPLIFSDQNPVYHYSAQALTNTEICMINTDLIKDFISSNHNFAKEVITILSNEVIKGHERMFSLTQMKIKGRFAELLLRLKEKIYKTPKMNMTITRKDMAELISTTPESISRLIKEFNDEKITETNGSEIHILDEEKLHILIKNHN